MENKEEVLAGERKTKNAAGIILLVLFAYSVISFALLFIIGKLIPSPLAEYMAFAYVYCKGGKGWLFALFLLLYIAAAALCALTASENIRKKLPVLIPAALLVFADLAVNAYAYLAAEGYQWIYLICALFDGPILFCMLYRRKDNKKGV